MNGRGGPIAPVNIQATDFGLKNHMIQQVQNSCQFHGLPSDDANKHLDKFLTVTQSMKQNGVPDDSLRLFLFPYSLTHHATAWNDINNFLQLPDESLFEAWERYKLSIDRCPNHNMLPVTQIDTFYNELTLRHQDTINVAAGGTFMKRRPEECYDLRNIHPLTINDWILGALPSNTVLNPQEDIKVITARSGITLAGPSVPSLNPPSSSSKGCTTCVPSPIIHPPPTSKSNEIPERNPHQPPIPYPSRLNKDKLQDKSDIQIHKFLQMFKKLHFNISFTKALAQMPKYAKMLKDLLSNKEKLLELANTPLNENCSAVLLKKLPEKLRDPRKFLIPCDFSELEECMALADLGASINLMPLSVWKKLMLPELVPTRMTLELANRSVAYPAGIAEDVFVQVGKFTFPADFVVVDYDVDPRVPLILGRPFLRMARALVDVYGEELTLRVGDEKLVFNIESTSKYPHKHGDESINQIDIIDTTCEDHFHEVLNVQKSIHPLSGSPTPSSDPVVASFSLSRTPFGDSDFLLEETDTLLALDDSIPPEINEGIFDPEGDILLLKKLLNNNSTKDLPPKELKND
ncbi:reverse transcriptase domain-containing protein [Tanacetum coccineum]|uniref:Reverse transcriptase domain-containing protein n=1 Tax=Tanacetum coccineum TaxID=301880 RepID=A0ABQ4Y2M0_9ASTR